MTRPDEHGDESAPGGRAGEVAVAPERRLQLGMAGRGALRWVAVDITDIVREVRDRLDLTPVAAAALGRAVAGASMLLRLATKTPSRLVLDIRGDGPLRQVLVEVDEEGNIRGTVGDPRVVVPDLPNTKLAVGNAVGAGNLRVLREFGDGGSYHSHVALQTGEIGDDLAHYLEQSEQSRSAVLVGVLGRKSGTGPLRYRCRCSRERLQRHLVLLSAEDRDYLAEEDGAIEADCVFCGNHYRFTSRELAELTGEDEPGALSLH